MAILPPWHMLASMSRKAAGLPDISRPTSKPSFMPSCFCTSASASLRDVDGQRRAHLAGQVQAVRIHVGDDDVARPGVAHDGGGHDADRPGAGDQHVLAEHVERQGRVDGVAERIEDRRPRRDRWPGRDARRWSSAGHRYSANAPGRLTPTPLVSLHRCRRPARQLRQRPQTTWPSPLTMSPGWKSLDVGADLDDLADELMADDHRHGNGLLGPGVPVVDVHVGAADAGAQHVDQHVVDADLRHAAPLRATGPVRPCV